MTLPSCLERFDVTVGLLQTGRALSRAACELVLDSFDDGVRHVEVRLCPTLHTGRGLKPDEVVEDTVAGLEAGMALVESHSPGEWISAGLVVSILEGASPEHACELAALAVRHAGCGVVGLDLAGDESLFDAGLYERAFALAKDAGLGVTIHAGEGQDASHITDAITRLGADRVGHATSAAGHPAVLDLLAQRGVTVEACLSSNVHTGSASGIELHPLPDLMAHGVRAVLATDNRFFSDTTLTNEYRLASTELGLGREDIEKLIIESARSAFLPETDRARLEETCRAHLSDAPA